MATDHERPVVPPKPLNTDYPVIDTDPHVKRVFGYARLTDYLHGIGLMSLYPITLTVWERVQPTELGTHNFVRALRAGTAIGVIGGVIDVYQRSTHRFLGLTENAREQEMDMREMVGKAKRGEPLYGVSTMSPYMQGVAARNSRYSVFFAHVILWPNFANHNQHGVDTAKYFQQAERELEAERAAKEGFAKAS